jgi:hypothetical protein
MRVFLKNLERLQLARVERLPHGSLFVPVSGCAESCQPVSGRAVADLASSAVQELDKLPRYGATPNEEKQLREAMKLIAEMNRAAKGKFDGDYTPVPLDNLGSIAAAKKILRVVPFDRAVSLVFEACMAFTPDKTGGDLPRSLGHPFITKYVVNEYRRIERELSRGQLSLLFVERADPPRVYGARKPQVDEKTLADCQAFADHLLEHATPEQVEKALAEARQEFERIAGSPVKPRRL